MPIRILVVEDSENAGTLLATYLDKQLDRLIGIVTDDEIEDEDGYLHKGGGQLNHLLIPTWPAVKHEHVQARRADSAALKSLIELDDAVGLDSWMKETCSRLFGGYVDRPHILIVDMALSTNETEDLIQYGGDAEPRFGWEHELPDPRQTLRGLTGFDLLRHFRGIMPVIVTTYAQNPLVAQHCLINGASSIIIKPITDKAWRALKKSNKSIGTIEEEAAENRNDLSVVVYYYLLAVSAEVVKAINCLAFRLCFEDRAQRVARSGLSARCDSHTLVVSDNPAI